MKSLLGRNVHFCVTSFGLTTFDIGLYKLKRIVLLISLCHIYLRAFWTKLALHTRLLLLGRVGLCCHSDHSLSREETDETVACLVMSFVLRSMMYDVSISFISGVPMCTICIINK